ncbi:MAG: 30S ribosomal protein S12 methylthiotransferase RimO [Clostridia bacterium]|nr:30S ribosomal protein S12 methylthiotransferase RimO [Clostridia bacterium]
MKIGFVSLGCPKNQLDTEVMLHHLLDAGYEITPDETEADIIVINTCAFIEAAKKEAIDNILDIAWFKEHKSLKGIIVTGCMTERYREAVLEEFPEVDAVLGVGSIHKIVEAVKYVEEKGRGYSSFLDKNEVELGGDRVLTTPAHWTYLKIAEGCDNRCTYCAIPDIRGKFRSRPMEDIVKEAVGLEELGAKEIIVVAQDTTRYGLDLYGEYSLSKLLEELLKATKTARFRLLYCYPDKITDELCDVIAQNERIIKYIDIPIQHVNNDILRRMNRHGGEEAVRSAVAKLRERIPGITLRSTVIVGFPGETEEAFEELCQFIKDTEFDRLGAFPYSPEEGTPAATFPDQIDEQVKLDRADIIMQTQYSIMEKNNDAMIGKTVRVLVEDFDPVSEMHFGRGDADAPEIDGKVYFSARRRVAPGSIVSVKIEDVLDYDLCGKALLFPEA